MGCPSDGAFIEEEETPMVSRAVRAPVSSSSSSGKRGTSLIKSFSRCVLRNPYREPLKRL